MSVSHNHKAHQQPGKPAVLKNKPKLDLDRIIGNTILSNSGLAINSHTGDVAYAAGCVIVIYNPKQNKQVKFLMGKKNKAIGSLCFSPNGKYLAAGEVGYQPSVLVFELATKQILAELKGHKFGISCVAFSPNNKILCSIGFEHDGLVNVWEWRSSTLVCGSKVTSKVHAVSFAEDGSYFVTAGNKHIKFWYLDPQLGLKSSAGAKTKLVESKSAILGSHKDSDYLDIACGRGANSSSVFTVNDKGHLCIVNPVSRVMEKWIDMRTNGKARSISVNEKMIACGCNDGVIRLFSPDKLEYIATVPKPNPLGQDVKILDEKGESHERSSGEKVYPDTIACKLNEDGTKLISVYGNRSLFIWDIKDPAKVPKYRSSLAHSGCIWDIALPPIQNAAMPPGTFVTCSADHSIRFWNVDPTYNNKNVYSKEMIQSIPVVNDIKELKHEHQLESLHVGDGGLRCLSFSWDGRRIASGDRGGNLRVHNTDSLKCISFTEAHDAEILSLDYAHVNGKDLLASGSRDRLIHVFENTPSNDEYSLFSTLDEHSASITSVKFAQGGSKILSSGADKSITFSQRQDDHFARYHVTTVHGTIYDTQLDPSEKLLITAGQEKKFNIYDINSSKLVKSIKTDAESDEIVRIELDPSGQFLAASSQDRHIRVYHLESGELISNVSGHSELVTGLKFSSDCSHLISISGDGCIFLWRWPDDFSETLRASAAAIKPARATRVFADPRAVLNNTTALPVWARKALGEHVETTSDNTAVAHPSGEWAKRVGDLTIGNNVYKWDDNQKLPLESSESKQDPEPVQQQKPHAEPAEEEAVFLEDESSKEVSQQQFEVTATQQPTPHVVPHHAHHGSHGSAHSSQHSTPVVPHHDAHARDGHHTLNQSKDVPETDVIEDMNFEEDLNSFAEFMQGPTKLMKSNFENLTEKFLPTQKVDSGRLSLSSKHLNHVTKQLAKERQQHGKASPVKVSKHGAENAPENSQAASAEDAEKKTDQSGATKPIDRSDLDKIKERKEQLAREVEQTRVRLEQLGALIKHPAPVPVPEQTQPVTSNDTPVDTQLDTAVDAHNDTVPGVDDSVKVDGEEDEVVNVDDVVDGDEIYDEYGEEQIDEYDQTLFNLQSSFRDAVRLFRRLQQQQFETGDPDTGAMVERYYDAFGDMKLTLNSVVLDDGAANLQSTLLERYSELLLATVREKLVSGNVGANNNNNSAPVVGSATTESSSSQDTNNNSPN